LAYEFGGVCWALMRGLSISVCLLTAIAVTQTTAQGPSRADELKQAENDIQRGRIAEGVAILEKLNQTQPAMKSVAHDLGLAQYRNSKLIAAKEAFTKAIQDDPADKESVQMLGLTLYRMGQPAAAIPYLERVREWTPNSQTDANYVLGLCYLNAQRYDDARKSFATQFGVQADSGPAYLLFSDMLMKANLPELAANAAHKALQLLPGLPLAHFTLGEVALFKSSVEDALTEFEAERALDPGYAPVYDRLGDAYTRLEKYEEAQQALMKAISLDSSRTGPFILMGKVLLRRNDGRSALLYLRHAAKMDPNNYITHTLLGQVYRSLGDEDNAKQEFEAGEKLQAAGELKLDDPH